MAKQEGIIKITGKIGDFSFYKTADGYKARQKGGVEGSKIKNDPAFSRTRENMEEFGTSASSGKLLRDAVRTLIKTASDSKATSRLTKVMAAIKNLDTSSARGKRTVGVGIADPSAKAVLKGFNFNMAAIMSSMFFVPYALNTATGEISISSFVPANDLAAPLGATHMSLKGAWAKVDFAGNTSDVKYSNTVNLPLNTTASAALLTPSASPTGSGTDIYFLHIAFFQEVNSVQYPLNNGAFNAMSIIEVL